MIIAIDKGRLIIPNVLRRTNYIITPQSHPTRINSDTFMFPIYGRVLELVNVFGSDGEMPESTPSATGNTSGASVLIHNNIPYWYEKREDGVTVSKLQAHMDITYSIDYTVDAAMVTAMDILRDVKKAMDVAMAVGREEVGDAHDFYDLDMSNLQAECEALM